MRVEIDTSDTRVENLTTMIDVAAACGADTLRVYTRYGGPRLVTEETRKEMRKMLAEFQDGTYARNWIEEDRKGRPWFNATRKSESEHRIETVGEKLRAMMPFLKPVKHKQPAGV